MNLFLHLLIVTMVTTSATTSVLAQEDSILTKRTETVQTKAGDDFNVEHTDGVDTRFMPVIERLVADGWDRAFVMEAFHDNRLVFIPKMVRVNRPKGGKTNWSAYSWVNTRESADACKRFISKYDEYLNQAETKYGVDKETVAALLRCETRHGEVTGDYHVFSVYASMALMNEQEFLQTNLDRAESELKEAKASKKKTSHDLSYIRSRSRKRGDWAYKELKNLLTIQKEQKTDALALYGSWAGAFGWAQFLPSSYLRSAVDGDGDGKIDLFDPADAIYSVANYLSKAGYKSGSSSKIKRAIRSYNPSTPYVESIYGLADRLQTN